MAIHSSPATVHVCSHKVYQSIIYGTLLRFFLLFRDFYSAEEYSENVQKCLNYICGSQNALLQSFSSQQCTWNSAERFSTIMRMLPVKTQVFGLKNVTGHRNGAAECLVLVSGGLDNLRESKWKVTM